MRKLKETILEKAIAIMSFFSIVILILILIFLINSGIPLFKTVSLKEFFLSSLWRPISEPPRFGIVPLVLGSLLVTFGAVLIGVPLGVGCAVYIAEVAGERAKEYFKVLVELIAGIPSVVLGFIGMVVLSSWVRNLFDLPTGLTAFTGAVTLAFMVVPTIATLSEDAINAVPKEYISASLALGATRWQTICRVIIPSSASGIFAAILLGFGRAIGETMVVMMVCGNAAVIPHGFFEPVRTLTATIASEMGETVRGSEHYYALFAVGLVLFTISFSINLIADIVLRRKARGA
jgi:phosphate transport system permease protein